VVNHQKGRLLCENLLFAARQTTESAVFVGDHIATVSEMVIGINEIFLKRKKI
jgi:hypothetical protein